MKSFNSLASNGKVIFRSKGAFWLGFFSVAIGVALQLPMYINAKNMHYRLVGMPMGTSMNIGMALVVVGLLITLYSLIPPKPLKENQEYDLKVRALDDAPINKTHIGLLIVMAIAITLDVMKPTILSFVVPGMAREYGLKSPLYPHATIPVALLPLCGITGTVIGSFIWGWLGDKIGRKSSILMAGITFIATSACGSMPEFWMNCIMCFIMGWGVGGNASYHVYANGRKYSGKASRLDDGFDRRRYCRSLRNYKRFGVVARASLYLEDFVADRLSNRLHAYLT